MSDLSVNIGPRLARQGGSAAQILSAIVPDPPRAILALDNGTILRGVVQGRDNDGMTIIATDKGTIRVPLNPPLPPGTAVTMEVRIAGDRMQVLILASDAASQSGGKKAESGEALPGPNTGGAGGLTRGAGAPNAEQVSANKTEAALAPARTAQVVTQLGSTVEAIIIRAEPEALRQILASSAIGPSAGGPSIAGPSTFGQNVGAPGKTTENPPGTAANTQGQQNQAAPLPSRSVAQSLLSVLQPELRARIESLFQEKPAAGATPSPQGVQPGGQPGPRGIGSDIGANLVAQTVIPGTGVVKTSGEPSVRVAGPAGVLFIQNPTMVEHGLGSPSGHIVGSPWAALANGAEIRIRVVVPQSPLSAHPVLPGTGSTDGMTISGRIVGHTPSGATIVATPFGAVVLMRDLALPIGAEITLTLESQPNPPAAAAAPLAVTLSPQQMLLQASRGWPTLAELVMLLRAQSTSTGTADPARLLPQVGPKLAAGLLNAMRAIRQGDVEALLGPAIRQGRAGDTTRDEAIKRLRREIGQLSQFASERTDSEWRCCFLPLWDDGAVRQINLFHRRGRQGNGKGGEEAHGARFVVEVDFSRLGAFQFDGLVQERKFDLIVRSRISVQANMRQEIGELFQEALEIGGYKGNIVFQTMRDFPVAPLDEIARRATKVSA